MSLRSRLLLDAVDAVASTQEGLITAAQLERGTDLTNAGLIVVHIVPTRFRQNPYETLERVQRAHELGLTRPRPDLTIVSVDEFDEIRRGWGGRNFGESA